MSHFLRVAPVAVLLSALVTTACGQAAPPPAPAAPANPLEGTWSMTSVTPADGSAVITPSQPGLYTFGKGYYSAVFTLGANPRVPSATPFQATADEKVAQHDTIIVNAGTYTVSGSTITFRPIIAKSPEFVGGHATAEYVINGDTLTLMHKGTFDPAGVAAPNAGDTLTFTRVE